MACSNDATANKYLRPEKDAFGVRLNVTVGLAPSPETLLALQFKIRKLVESVVACPAVQLPAAPCKLKLFVAG